jgi:hypothetical protein
MLLNHGSLTRVLRTRAFAFGTIAALSALVYFPAIDNSFISDDFGIFPLLEALERNPAYIFDTTSELFRATSYVYFWAIFKLFGAVPEPFYLAGIALHAIVSILVCVLVRRVTGNALAGWAAGLFFAAYERHQEAVMWISAVNETILALNCVVFLLLWDRRISSEKARPFLTAMAFVVFALALFSKEAAIAMVPMAVLVVARHAYRVPQIIARSIPVAALAMTVALLWVWQADRNFFVADGYYAISLHFFPVFVRAVVRLLLPAMPFAAMLFWRWRHKEMIKGTLPGLTFFGVLLLVALVPYSFLTYQDHLPSRHTYLASIGLAGVIGTLFAATQMSLTSERFKHIYAVAFGVLLLANVSYVWLKKEPQFRERAAPTRELLDVLNSTKVQMQFKTPVSVCGFPFGQLGKPWWFPDAISRFTSLSREDVVLRDNCATAAPVLTWDSTAAKYVFRSSVDLAAGQ